MKKDWLLLIVTVVVTLTVSLGILRCFAPQLIGISPDMRLVQIEKKVPPFFEHIFKPEDLLKKEGLINDPVTGVRNLPFKFIEKNGWPPGVVKTVTNDYIDGLPLRGVVNEINPSLYGPLER